MCGCYNEMYGIVRWDVWDYVCCIAVEKAGVVAIGGVSRIFDLRGFIEQFYMS
jgi:hypothetical protein